MEEMIAFRWFVAGGGKESPFTEEVLDEIFRVSLGLTREVVKLCDLTLLAAFSKGRTTLSVSDVQGVAKELNLKKK
jgi:hypothetical protein